MSLSLSLFRTHTYRVVEIVGEEEVSCRLVPLTLAVEPRGQQLRAVMIGTSLNWRHSKRSLTMTTHRVGTIILCDHQCIRIAWWRGWYIRRIMYTVSAITSLINSKYMIACDRLVCTLEKNGSKVCEAISIGVFCQKPPDVAKPHVWRQAMKYAWAICADQCGFICGQSMSEWSVPIIVGGCWHDMNSGIGRWSTTPCTQARYM